MTNPHPPSPSTDAQTKQADFTYTFISLAQVQAFAAPFLPRGTEITFVGEVCGGKIVEVCARFRSGEILAACVLREFGNSAAIAQAIITAWRINVDNDVSLYMTSHPVEDDALENYGEGRLNA